MPTKIEQILEEYERMHARYLDFTNQTAILVRELLKSDPRAIHSISSRVKTKESLALKLARPDKHYGQLADVTDLSGLRVITYFAMDVDEISVIFEREFSIDRINSVDKRQTIDPDRFGYLSQHFVASYAPERVQLTEYRRFAGLKTEIQIRSILQHAWAEIEHDLGYKTRQAVPRDVQRQFSRVAGVLELADSEFDSLKKQQTEYARAVADEINTLASVAIDKVSIGVFVEKNDVVADLDRQIARASGATLREASLPAELLASIASYFKLKSLAELERELTISSAKVVGISNLTKRDPPPTIGKGISVFYLFFVLAGRHGLLALKEYLERFNIGNSGDREAFARTLLAFINADARA